MIEQKAEKSIIDDLSSTAFTTQQPLGFVSAAAIRHHMENKVAQTGTVIHSTKGELYGEPDVAIYLAPPTMTELEEENAKLRAALEGSMTALDDWLNIFASDLCDPERVKEAKSRVHAGGTLWYIANVQERNRAAIHYKKKSV